jgi:hypothetical protein
MTRYSKGLTALVGLFFAFSGLGCATYQGKVGVARDALADGDFEKAYADLKPLAEKDNADQLVYLLDYATALQIGGNYPESNKVFLQADRLTDLVDYHSVSKIATSLALSEEMSQYKGDTFEKIFINAYLAMNFLEMGKLDDALVEARRINEKYVKFRSDDKQKFELNSFSKYLSAVIWEANRNYDDAYIAYNETYKIDSAISTLPEDLIRSAKNARRMDAYQDWKKKYPNVKEDPSWYDKKNGELVILYQQGWGPRKQAGANQYRFPELMPVSSLPNRAILTIDGSNQSYLSKQIYDVDKAAIDTLRDDYAMLIAKRVAGLATKAVLADQVRQQNEGLGQLAWIAMNLSDRADLRQWSTLPKSIQIIRVPLKAGKHKIKLQGADIFGSPATNKNLEREVEIKAGGKKFVVWRTL